MFVSVAFILLVLSGSKPVLSQSIENGCWPLNVVMFDMDTAFDLDEILLIQTLMRYISEMSCLRFIDLKEYVYAGVHRKYLQVRRSTSKYCRTIEEQRNGTVVLTVELGTSCTTRRGILHELMHILGFKHEQQRVDRKCYVRVFWSKVTQVAAFEVDFNNPDNDWIQRFPYDKWSIMHYSRSSKMKSRDERWFEWEPLGNDEGYFTQYDIWKINYKHCSVRHYCDAYPQHCTAMQSYEKSLGCKRDQ